MGQVCWGQVDGEYKSKPVSGTAYFGAKSSWLTFNGPTKVPANTWVNAIAAPGTASTVTIQPTHKITMAYSATISNLTVSAGGELAYSAGVTLIINSNLIIDGLITIIPGAVLNVSGITTLGRSECLLIQSNSDDYTGSLITGSFSGTGTIKVERFMSNSDNWHLYSSPVFQSYHDFILGNPEIPDLFTNPAIDNTYIGVGMRDYNTFSDSWSSYFNYRTDTPSGNVGNCKGFSIRTYNDAKGTGYIYATGVPNSSLSIALNTTGNKWNCIGNPFTSGLSVSSFISTNSSLLDPSFVGTYIWDSVNSVYISYNSSSNSNIQLGQGFFVKTNSTGGSISFSSSMQVNETSLPFKSAEMEWPLIKILI
ncbi:MAG TPA: hypothetical protein VGK38_00310, partial [Prolixibacteraceae bacterium]